MRGCSIIISPFSELLLGEKQNLIQNWYNNVQLDEMEEAEAILSGISQIQFEMAQIRRKE